MSGSQPRSAPGGHSTPGLKRRSPAAAEINPFAAKPLTHGGRLAGPARGPLWHLDCNSGSPTPAPRFKEEKAAVQTANRNEGQGNVPGNILLFTTPAVAPCPHLTPWRPDRLLILPCSPRPSWGRERNHGRTARPLTTVLNPDKRQVHGDGNPRRERKW